MIASVCHKDNFVVPGLYFIKILSFFSEYRYQAQNEEYYCQYLVTTNLLLLFVKNELRGVL